jgi:hypothetical protein
MDRPDDGGKTLSKQLRLDLAASSILRVFGDLETNVAVAMPMNMHKHSSSDEKGIFVDSRVERLARKIICLTIQTAAKFDNRAKSGALTKMSFSLDIAQDNTGGPAGMKYQRIHSLQCLRLVCALGSSRDEDSQCIKPRREMLHHLPTLRQNHHHRVNENERSAS